MRVRLLNLFSTFVAVGKQNKVNLTKINFFLVLICSLSLMSCGTGKKGLKVHLLHSGKLEFRQTLSTRNYKAIQKAERAVNVEYAKSFVSNTDDQLYDRTVRR